ncbi:MAG: VWA domain-containing protein [Ectothiorhodospiraceae bacterium]|jgi:uncharacterized protein with von Willebrand factor type A (vWA) domain
MLIGFLQALRDAGLKVGLNEFLTLLEALDRRLALASVEDFYYLARAALVKDETRFDRFDRVFASYFRGAEALSDILGEAAEIPEEWLRRQAELYLSEQEKQQIEGMGWERLMEELRARLREQDSRHQGGNKWIGTAGRSPYGAYGYNPEGVRIGQDRSRHRRAVKVWDRREFRNLDDSRELGTRTMKLALRRLRRFARQGAPEVLDLDDTIRSTARNAGTLDLKMVPEKHNAAKLLLFFDVGGSMDDHVRICEELFSAARAEFHHLEYFYFHNCPYERLWKDSRRRHSNFVSTWEVLRTYGNDHHVVFVGDATMSPYEIVAPGASVEHWNEEAGEQWMRRLLAAFPKAVWLNPEPESRWDWTPSVRILNELLGGRMFPLTLAGLDAAMRSLRR